MSDFVPTNDLDRAIMAMRRSAAGTPEFYRQLAQGELWFLVPYHPEVEDADLELKNGSPLPFAVLRDDQGEVVPLFSSEGRLHEGLERGRVPPHTYLCGDMPARQVLEILGHAGLRAVVNKSCATGEVTIPPDLMRALADGSALAPHDLGRQPEEQMSVIPIDAADYPTDLIQPVFEVLRRHPQFRAAWVFGFTPAAAPPAEQRGYCLTLLMEPRDETLLHEVNLVAHAARPPTHEIKITLVDETDAGYVAQLFAAAPPFFTAADYGRPPFPS